MLDRKLIHNRLAAAAWGFSLIVKFTTVLYTWGQQLHMGSIIKWPTQEDGQIIVLEDSSPVWTLETMWSWDDPLPKCIWTNRCLIYHSWPPLDDRISSILHLQQNSRVSMRTVTADPTQAVDQKMVRNTRWSFIGNNSSSYLGIQLAPVS
jgi:hypothetical protein